MQPALCAAEACKRIRRARRLHTTHPLPTSWAPVVSACPPVPARRQSPRHSCSCLPRCVHPTTPLKGAAPAPPPVWRLQPAEAEGKKHRRLGGRGGERSMAAAAWHRSSQRSNVPLPLPLSKRTSASSAPAPSQAAAPTPPTSLALPLLTRTPRGIRLASSPPAASSASRCRRAAICLAASSPYFAWRGVGWNEWHAGCVSWSAQGRDVSTFQQQGRAVALYSKVLPLRSISCMKHRGSARCMGAVHALHPSSPAAARSQPASGACPPPQTAARNIVKKKWRDKHQGCRQVGCDKTGARIADSCRL